MFLSLLAALYKLFPISPLCSCYRIILALAKGMSVYWNRNHFHQKVSIPYFLYFSLLSWWPQSSLDFLLQHSICPRPCAETMTENKPLTLIIRFYSVSATVWGHYLQSVRISFLRLSVLLLPDKLQTLFLLQRQSLLSRTSLAWTLTKIHKGFWSRANRSITGLKWITST